LGDFRLSALGDACDDENALDIPAFNQQEGTLTSIAKRVLPTNSALEFGGYELNDLMKELIANCPNETIDWTPLLPTDKGFKSIKFDDLANTFGNDGSDNRGYKLSVTSNEVSDIEVDEFDENDILEGEIAYRCNPARQFNDFSDKAHQIFETFSLYASKSKCESLGEKVEVTLPNGTITLDVVVDEKMTGDIIEIPDFKSAKDVYSLFDDRRYQTVTIKKV
jgi:NADH-quinone oxidoreductase subunit G